MCNITLLSSHALPEITCRFCQKIGYFGAKSSKFAHTKTALRAKGANFFNGFCFFVIKGSNKNQHFES